MFEFKVCDSLDEVRHLVNDKPTFSDIETDGLYINTRLVQIYQPDTDPMIYILDTDIIPLHEIKEFIKPLWTVWYNASYDFGTLNMTTDKFDDLFYLVKTAFPKFQEYSLDKVITRFGYGHLYEKLNKKALQKQGFVLGAYLSHSQLLYSATDVYALSKMWDNREIQKGRNILAYKVDIMSMKYAIQYQQNGMPVDQSLVRKELDNIIEDIDKNYEFLNGLNPNSPKQCKEALGTTSTDKNTLIKLIAQGNKLAEVIFKQRRLLKKKNMLESYNFPRVYTRYNVAGAITGRFTATGGDIKRGINSQQIPRDLQYLFKPADPDKVVIEADYSTLELRLACAIFKEYEMYRQLKNGEDLHTSMAREMTGKKDITKEERIKAKAINFGFVFGMSAPTFQEYSFVNFGVKFTEQEAVEIRNKYFTKYPTIKKYHANVWNGCKAGTYIYKTALGRRVKPRRGTDGINGPVQGSGGETTKLAVHYMVKATNGECLKHIINVVHDAIYLEIPKKDLEYWSDILRNSMLKAWREISKTSLFHYKDIPIDAEVEIV